MLTAQLHQPTDSRPLPGTLAATAEGFVFTPVAEAGHPGATIPPGPGSGSIGSTGSLLLPSPGLAARRGGFDDATIFLRHEAHPGVEVSVVAARVGALPALAGHPAVAALGHQQRRSVRRFWGCLGAIAVGLLGLVIAAVFAWSTIVAWAVGKVPTTLERDLGAAAFATVRAGGTLIEDPAVDAALADLVAPLSLPPEIAVHVLADDTVNAFALPGGPVVFHAGLLSRAETPEEVLGVLGHELAHVELRHGLRQLINNLGLTVVLQLVVGDASVLASAAGDLANLSYSRDLEREADLRGVEHLVRVGVDPRGLLRFLDRLAVEEGSAGAAAPALTFLATHPSSAERVARLEDQITRAGGEAHTLDAAALARLQTALARLQTAHAGPAGP